AAIPVEDKDAKDVPAINNELVPAEVKDEAKKEDRQDSVIPVDAKNGTAPEGKDYVIPIDAGQPCKTKPPMQPSPGVVWTASCNRYCGCGRVRIQQCTQKLWIWLTYRPLSRLGLAGCCQKCCDCHVPPLYTYFLDHCHAAGCSCGTGAAPGGQGGAHP